MADTYGSDFITIVDEDGTEFELEVLTSIEYNGETYMAVTLAGNEDEDLEISILKSVEEEDGEPILCAVEDEVEMETVYNLILAIGPEVSEIEVDAIISQTRLQTYLIRSIHLRNQSLVRTGVAVICSDFSGQPDGRQHLL